MSQRHSRRALTKAFKLAYTKVKGRKDAPYGCLWNMSYWRIQNNWHRKRQPKWTTTLSLYSCREVRKVKMAPSKLFSTVREVTDTLWAY